ncbi:N-6 DNA methylase [uncultured Cocleimonas sp.]|uniref:N-6 DNA methylase n=1 Tax=uncultured Cocleimonas sp. TaxID=1051587 RepID=UPI002611A446|nr:N-6 DNA methylase [uncultured Cocleimonas sp.]
MSQSTNKLTSQIWSITDLLKGNFKVSQYVKIIIPLLLLCRLDSVFKDSKNSVIKEYEKSNWESISVEVQERILLQATNGLSYFNISQIDFPSLEGPNLAKDIENYIKGYSKDVRQIFECLRFVDYLHLLNDSELLYKVLEFVRKMDLTTEAISDQEMGSVFDHIARRFSENSHGMALEHNSPNDILSLMVALVFRGTTEEPIGPNTTITIYDPTVGEGGLLSEGINYFQDSKNLLNINLYGQEINAESYAISMASLLIRGQDVSNIRLGNSLSTDQFQNEKFDYMFCHPPFGLNWKTISQSIRDEYETRGFNGRFGPGLPRIGDASLLFLLHLVNKLRGISEDGSRIAIVLNGSPMFSGDAGSGESEIRRYILESDLLESIIALPSDLLFTTGIPTYIWILSNKKTENRKGKVQIIDAENLFSKMRKPIGNKRNEIQSSHIDTIIRSLDSFSIEDMESSNIFETTDFGYRKVTVMLDENTRTFEKIPLNQDIYEYLNEEILPYSPNAKIDESVRDKNDGGIGIVGYEINYNRIKQVSQINRLETQYKNYQTIKLKHLTSERNILTSDGMFKDTANAIYINKNGIPKVVSNLADIKGKHKNNVQVVLKHEAISDYVESFFKSTLGQLTLLASTTGDYIPHLNLEALENLEIALPDIDEQKNVVNTLTKLLTLRDAIDQFDEELAISPTSSKAVMSQLDSMLETIGSLTDADAVRGIIREGETEKIEFKSSFRLDLKKQEVASYLEVSALKTVVAFLNSRGGVLLIGIADDGEILGLPEVDKFHKGSFDNFLLHWKNKLKTSIGEEFYPFIRTKRVDIDDKYVLKIECNPGTKPCYLDGKDFYVRTNPASDKLEGPKLVDYVNNHFNK